MSNIYLDRLEQFVEQVRSLRAELKLEPSPSKKLITHATSHQAARFLGYGIKAQRPSTRHEDHPGASGGPALRGALIHDQDFTIVAKYQAEYAGFVPLVARFGGIPLRRQRTAVLTDQRPIMVSAKRNELIHRLLADRCEICETRTNLEVHHIRKLADLNKPGRREKPPWMRLMASRRRKTLVICRPCHEDIHAGRATAPKKDH